MANFTCLLAARSWWAAEQGADADDDGLAGLPAPVILSSGYVHPSAVQAIGHAGLAGRTCAAWRATTPGALDLDALDAAAGGGGRPRRS